MLSDILIALGSFGTGVLAGLIISAYAIYKNEKKSKKNTIRITYGS